MEKDEENIASAVLKATHEASTMFGSKRGKAIKAQIQSALESFPPGANTFGVSVAITMTVSTIIGLEKLLLSSGLNKAELLAEFEKMNKALEEQEGFDYNNSMTARIMYMYMLRLGGKQWAEYDWFNDHPLTQEDNMNMSITDMIMKVKQGEITPAEAFEKFKGNINNEDK